MYTCWYIIMDGCVYMLVCIYMTMTLLYIWVCMCVGSGVCVCNNNIINYVFVVERCVENIYTLLWVHIYIIVLCTCSTYIQ